MGFLDKVKEVVSHVATEDGTTTMLGRPVRYHCEGSLDNVELHWKARVEDVRLGVSATAGGYLSRFTSLRYALQKLLERLCQEGVPECCGIDTHKIAESVTNCVEDSTTCPQHRAAMEPPSGAEQSASPETSVSIALPPLTPSPPASPEVTHPHDSTHFLSRDLPSLAQDIPYTAVGASLICLIVTTLVFYCWFRRPAANRRNQQPMKHQKNNNQQCQGLLGPSNLAEVTRYLQPLEKDHLYDLGIVLGIDRRRIKDLRDSSKTTTQFCDSVIEAWLQRVDNVKTEPSWSCLVLALQSNRLKQTGVAGKIAEEKGCTL